jgi:hypothetical protein
LKLKQEAPEKGGISNRKRWKKNQKKIDKQLKEGRETRERLARSEEGRCEKQQREL